MFCLPKTAWPPTFNLYLEYFKLFGIDEYIMRLSTHHPRGLGKKYVNNQVGS